MMDTLTTDTDTPEIFEAEHKYEWLVGRDRCDRCGSQAYVRAVNGSMDLIFCGHHGQVTMPMLLAQGFTVQDDTHLLLEAEKAMKATLDHA
jgi:hypothetical protein